MTSYNTSSANTSGNAYLYGYVFTTTTSKPIVSIEFPSNVYIRILAIDEINAAQQNDPEDGVIEGDAIVAGNERLGIPLTKAAPVALATTAPSIVPTFGDDLVSSALDEITNSAAPTPYLGKIAAGIGPNWAGQLGDEAGGSVALGQLFASRSALMFRPKGRLFGAG